MLVYRFSNQVLLIQSILKWKTDTLQCMLVKLIWYQNSVFNLLSPEFLRASTLWLDIGLHNEQYYIGLGKDFSLKLTILLRDLHIEILTFVEYNLYA